MRKSLIIGIAFAMMAWMFAATAGPASADGSVTWQGQGWPNATCQSNPQNMLWIFTGKGVTSVTFHWDSTSAAMTQEGSGAWHVTTPFFDPTVPPTPYVTYTGTLSGNGQVVLSGCNESGPTTAALIINKTIPNVLEGTETVTVTFEAVLSGTGEGGDNDPTTLDNPSAVNAGTCSITFTAGQTNETCTISGLAPNTAYDIYETNTGGFTPQPFQTATTGAAGTVVDGPTFVNTFGPATAQACKITDTDNTGHNASGDHFTFELFANGQPIDTDPVTAGVQPDTVTVNGGGTALDPNCVAFATQLADNVTYTITETGSPTGYTQTSFTCDVNGIGPVTDFTPQYPGDAGALFTCTATDAITAAHATVRKVTVPAGHEAGWTFDLKANGVTVETVTTTDATAVNFTTDLQDGVHYTVVEHTQAEWDPSAGAECDFTVSYPADSGRTFSCVFTNTHVSAGLTPGYWKNHLAVNGSPGCTGLPTGTGCSRNGPFTKTYLPLNLGNYTVSTIQQAAAVFVAMNCSNSSTSTQNAVGCLAGQLLAAELNVANGASHCANSVITAANNFLVSITYTGPSGTYSLSSAQRSTAVSLAGQLSAYNAGTCPI